MFTHARRESRKEEGIGNVDELPRTVGNGVGAESEIFFGVITY